MKKIILSCFLMCLLFPVYGKGRESGVIYRNGGIIIEYDRKSDHFIYRNNDYQREYTRFRYRDMILNEFSQIPVGDRTEVERRLELIKNTYRISDPSPEEVLKSSFDNFDNLNKVSSYECGESYAELGNERPHFIADVEIPKIEVADTGFLNLGELESVEFELNTQNDNPLHGLLLLVNATSYEKRDTIEGDDRGLTFGAAPSVRFKYEEGELLIKYSSKLYTKMTSRPCGLVTVGGIAYEKYCYKNNDGTWNQEALNRDDFDISIYRRLGDDKSTYLQIGSGFTILDDKGVSANLQKSWHELSKDGVIQYQNVEHMDRVVSPKANIKIGKIIDLAESENNISLSSEIYTGAQVSYIGGNEDFVSVGGSLNLVIDDNNKDKFPILETRLYYNTEYTALDEVNRRYGIETRANLHETEDSVVFIKIGMGIEDDHYNRLYEKYGESFLHESQDIQHYLGVGYEMKF